MTILKTKLSTALALGALLLTPTLSSNLYASAHVEDDTIEIVSKGSYTYGDIYAMATIAKDRSVTFTNNTDQELTLVFHTVPYSVTDDQANLMAVSDDTSAASGSAAPLTRSATLHTRGSATFSVPSDDECLFGVAQLNDQTFRVNFFKDTLIPTSFLRSLMGFRKKKNGWVIKASEL